MSTKKKVVSKLRTDISEYISRINPSGNKAPYITPEYEFNEAIVDFFQPDEGETTDDIISDFKRLIADLIEIEENIELSDLISVKSFYMLHRLLVLLMALEYGQPGRVHLDKIMFEDFRDNFDDVTVNHTHDRYRRKIQLGKIKIASK